MPEVLEIENFLIKARLQTYTSGSGVVEPLLNGSYQLEFSEGDWFYRDIYYMGKSVFNGMDTVYFKGKPVFSNSYYGNWGYMTEEQIDLILRGALVANPETRLYTNIIWKKEGYEYACGARFNEGIDRIHGIETITKNGEQIYEFTYQGGLLI